MPINTELATKVWNRYAFCRDNGHEEYTRKVDKCEAFFRGDQWDRGDKVKLDLVRRPALTINKIISTVSNVMGEQIFNRAETSFRPRSGANPEIADILSKVYRQISDDNQLDWKRSDMFADGIIGSRGFLDVRIAYNDNMQGEVRIENMNPKNVVIDPDADQYDPDSWGEVHTTKWMTADDIAVLYSKADADLLRNREQSFYSYGYDSIETLRDRFGDRHNPMYQGDYDNSNVLRNIRVIERQYRTLDRQKHFLSTETGDTREIPTEFSRDKIAFFVEKYGFKVITKLVRRIKWDVVADNVELFSDWSQYKHFTIVPFFPYLRHGHTIGLVENLLGSQELLNKATSQELHVVNTTANSGYKVKAGALTNMTTEELEQKGAQTGIVIEVNEMDGLEKITPNAVPSGLDRVSYKAEEHIKTISGVSDSMQGMDRADVAAKAIQEKKKSGSTNLVKPMDSLTRTDFILARNVLDLVQEFYTEERLMTITHNEATGETESFSVNQPNPKSQEEHDADPDEFGSPYEAIINDLTLGKYTAVVSSVPKRETLEDSQFEQAMSMREAGIAIPDSVLVDNSRLINKKEIIKLMDGDKTSPEALAAKQLEMRGKAATVVELEAKGAQKQADAGLKQAKTQETQVKSQVLANTPIDSGQGQQGNPELEQAQAEHDADVKERELAHKQRMDFMNHGLARKTADDNFNLKVQEAQQKRVDARAQAAEKAAAAAAKPATPAKI
jgi:hypothetical protein